MSITNCKKPIVFDVSKMSYFKMTILVYFAWLGWNITSSSLECIGLNYILKLISFKENITFASIIFSNFSSSTNGVVIASYDAERLGAYEG
jgi:hypothetical protein